VPIDDPLDITRRWVPKLRQQADLVIVVSHLGLWQDVALASSIPGIDLIVGGHSHHRLPALIRIGNTAIAQAGVAGAYLGVITLEDQDGSFRLAGRLEPIWQAIRPDARAQQQIQNYLRAWAPEALDIVGTLSGGWADPWEENAWATHATDSLRAHAKADICLLKASMLLPAFDSGPLTLWDLAQALTFAWPPAGELGDVICMRLTGAAIRAICEHSVVGLPRDVDPRIPDSFDLPCNTYLHASGITMTLDLSQPEGQRVRGLCMGGEPIDLQRQYRVVTSGFLARSLSGFHWFREGTERSNLGSIRQLLIASLLQCRSLPTLLLRHGSKHRLSG
jgi:2',3'-cyclic-nucleotide 2'-phosphodiesterase (5'-nucleotidase family)